MSWPAETLNTVCEIIMGQAPDGSFYNEAGEGVPLIAGAGDFGELTPRPKKYTTKASKTSQINDLILCIRATIGDLNWSDEEYCLGLGVAGLRPISDKLNRDYLWHFINANKIQLAAKGTGSTFKQVSRSDISEWEIPLPPLLEQKRIAAILDKADAIRRKRQQAIQLADEFLRAVFLDMFGDPVTNPKGWSLVPVHELGNVITGSTPPSSKDGMFGADIPFVTPGDLDSNLKQVVRWLSMEGVKHSRTCRQGSLMACCIGATIGKVAIANRISAFNQQINVIEWNKAVNDIYGYFLFKLNPAFITEKAIKTTLPILKKSLFEEIVLPVPSIELQNAFSERVLSTWEIQNKNTAALSYPLFESLSQLAFSGRL